MTTKPTTESNEDGELGQIAFRHDGFLANDEEEYLLKSEVLRLIKDRELVLLSRIKEEGPKDFSAEGIGLHPEYINGFNRANQSWAWLIDTIKAEIEGSTE